MNTPPKEALRTTLLARRSNVTTALREQLEQQLLVNCLRYLDSLHKAPQTIALYRPMRGEADITPLLEAITQNGAQAALPVTVSKNGPLEFRLWQGEPLTATDAWGIPVPTGPAIVPDLVLVPLVGFDRTGQRLGYGAGNYDRTLAMLPTAHTAGIAFALQEVQALAAEAHDIKLNTIITDREIIPCQD